MTSRAGHTSNEGLLNIRHVDLDDPDKGAIADVLGEALRQNYMESSVEWVTSHPDLSEPPFNLAAEGIFGDTALLEFGDMSYTKSQALLEKHMYNFEEFLKIIDRDSSDSFIFGHGILLFPRKLRPLVLNTSFLPATNKQLESKNKSRLTWINAHFKTCVTETLNFSDLKCTAQGTYFLCDGSKTDVSVLKVCAKKRRGSITHGFSENKRFIQSMQEALEKKFGSEHFVALGGVYSVDKVKWRHELVPEDWEQLKKTTVRSCYCDVNTPQTIITTFKSSTELHSKKLEFPMKLCFSQSTHSLNHHNSSVNSNNSYIFDPENVEYEGYFCPASKVYRIDEPL